MKINNVQGVYLLHFDPRYKHAGHYLGYADDIGRRYYEHEFDQSGCKLTSAAVKAGVKLVMARVWAGGDRTLERHLKGESRGPKHKGSLKRLCPICKGKVPSYEQVPVASVEGLELAATCMEAGVEV